MEVTLSCHMSVIATCGWPSGLALAWLMYPTLSCDVGVHDKHHVSVYIGTYRSIDCHVLQDWVIYCIGVHACPLL